MRYLLTFKVPENLILEGRVMGVFIDWLGDYSVGEIIVQGNDFIVQTRVSEENYAFVVDELTEFFFVRKEDIKITEETT